MIYIGSDHAGYETKEYIKKILDKKKLKYKDLGPDTGDKSVDYPDYAKAVAKAVVKGKSNRGILVCGSGTGMAMAANKIKNARAAMVYDKYSAVMSRKDNDSNIITLRGRGFSKQRCAELVKVWLATPFTGLARHKKRVKKLNTLR